MASKIIYLGGKMMLSGIFSINRTHVSRIIAMLSFSLAVTSAWSSNLVEGANATMDIEPGARSAALGSASMAVDDHLGLVSNPFQLARVRHLWAGFSHTAYYEDTQYDFASVVIPVSEGRGLGVSFSRFGADDIPYIREGEPIPEGSDYRTLSIADWMLSVTWGMRLTERLDLGLGFHGMYRDMDQSGWGFRGDAGLRYRAVDELYLTALLKGWTSSAVTWESGEFEYTAPELYLAASYSIGIPYLYGMLSAYWQSAGFIHEEARAVGFETDEDVGSRLWDDPLDWLSGGRGGLEFAFDFGLSLRVGLSSFTTFKSVTAGAGLLIAKFLRLDYAFESHPVLSPVHRVSVEVCPYLFGHAEAAPSGHLSPTDASRKVLDEEPLESEVEEPAPSNETPVSSDVPAESETPASVQDSPQETEVLESVPAGGTYWEED